MERTRERYRAQGFEDAYRWAQFDDVPFTPPSKPPRDTSGEPAPATGDCAVPRSRDAALVILHPLMLLLSCGSEMLRTAATEIL